MANDFVRNIKGIRNIDILSPNITTENDLISTSDGEVYVVTNKGYRKITGVETKEIKKLKTDVSNVKIQSDSNTLNISGNTDDIETNTSKIETLKKSTGNNTSEIETLKTSTGNNTSEIETLQSDVNTNTSEIETLKTSTDTNTSEIETLKTSTDNNTSEIETLKTTTENNTSEIETLQTDTSSNATSISDLLNEINTLKSNMVQHQVIYTGSSKGVDSLINLKDSLSKYSSITISGQYPGGRFNENHLLYNNDNIVVNRSNLTDSSGQGPIVYEVVIEIQDDKKLYIKNETINNLNTGIHNNEETHFEIERIEGWT